MRMDPIVGSVGRRRREHMVRRRPEPTVRRQRRGPVRPADRPGRGGRPSLHHHRPIGRDGADGHPRRHPPDRGPSGPAGLPGRADRRERRARPPGRDPPDGHRDPRPPGPVRGHLVPLGRGPDREGRLRPGRDGGLRLPARTALCLRRRPRRAAGVPRGPPAHAGGAVPEPSGRERPAAGRRTPRAASDRPLDRTGRWPRAGPAGSRHRAGVPTPSGPICRSSARPRRRRAPWSLRPTLVAAVALVLGSLLLVAGAQAYMTQEQVRLTQIEPAVDPGGRAP